MKYILVGLAFGGAWAAIQYAQGSITDPVTLAGPVVLFGLFGAALWGIRSAILWWRRKRPN